jgi:N-acetylglucosaminyldiphosphoundecaprenol N-acetyl-beta-D-mannosaminyltransferase
VTSREFAFAGEHAADGCGTRLRLGRLWIDVLTREQALDELRALVESGQGGAVFTPNVDHIAMVEHHAAFRRAYRWARLTFADGAPVVWASRLLGRKLPAKLSGSDLIRPIARLARERRWRVYLLGGGPGAAREAARRLRGECGVEIVGVDESHITLEGDLVASPIVARIRDARPDLILVALGAPKQELWMYRALPALAPAVGIGVGASLDYVAGTLRRAPQWMSKAGLEWLYRLRQEPRRLWRRYLVQDPTFALILLRTMRLRRAQRIRSVRRFGDATRTVARRVEPVFGSHPTPLESAL